MRNHRLAFIRFVRSIELHISYQICNATTYTTKRFFLFHFIAFHTKIKIVSKRISLFHKIWMWNVCTAWTPQQIGYSNTLKSKLSEYSSICNCRRHDTNKKENFKHTINSTHLLRQTFLFHRMHAMPLSHHIWISWEYRSSSPPCPTLYGIYIWTITCVWCRVYSIHCIHTARRMLNLSMQTKKATWNEKQKTAQHCCLHWKLKRMSPSALFATMKNNVE